MRSNSRRIWRTSLTVGATALFVIPASVWALTGGIDSPSYRTGRNKVVRGQRVHLPTECNHITGAAYSDKGDVLLVNAYQLGDDNGAQGRGGPWLIERKNNTMELLNDNCKGELSFGGSLDQLSCARISPDGRRVVGVRKVYHEDARALTATTENVMQALRANQLYKGLVLIDRDGGERSLVELAELESKIAANDLRVGVIAVKYMMWLDDRRVAIPVYSEESRDASWSFIYTINVDDGEVAEAFRADPGVQFGPRHRVSSGKLLVEFQGAEAHKKLSDFSEIVLQAALEERAIPAEQERQLLFADRHLAVLDLRTDEPSITVLENIDLTRLRNPRGRLSPDERFFAFRAGPPLIKAGFCLGLLDTTTGRFTLLEEERCDLQDWHPDGKRLLALLRPEAPADPAATLVEIRVDALLQDLTGEVDD